MDTAFYERCWRCRCAMPNGLVHRRVVRTGMSEGTTSGLRGHTFTATHYAPVSLCAVCDDEMAAEAALAAEAEKEGKWLFWRLCGGVWGTICLTGVGVPVLLSLTIMGVLARLRLVGRFLLTMHGVAMLAEALGYRPERYAPQIFATWGAITSGFILWRVWHAATLPWPFGWLARRRSQTPRYTIAPAAATASAAATPALEAPPGPGYGRGETDRR